MSLLINTISAIGNNSSVAPLLIRDCAIENPVKIGLTYKQNAKTDKKIAQEALRERAIEEYGTSAIWLGGIPLMNKLCNFAIKKIGYNPEINPKLFKESKNQGLKYNIENFSKKAPQATDELKKILKNKKTYEALLAGKFVASTAIPIYLMGFLLPKLNFGLTKKLREEKKTNKEINFKGNLISTIANLTTPNQMAITDVGLSVGRIKSARNKNEKVETAFKMSGMMLLNYVAPSWIQKGLDLISKKLFNTNVDLDVRLMNDKSFVEAIKSNSLELPKENIISYIDKNPKSAFTKLTQDYCEVKFLKDSVRDPRSFVDEEKIKSFINNISDFIKEAKNSGNIEKYAKKAIKVKSFNIILNIVSSSILLAYCLPKATFALRKKFTGKENEPGLI